MIRHICGYGTAADAIFEDEGHVILNFFESGLSEKKIFFGFAWEADNDIGGEVHIGDDVAEGINDFLVSSHGVGALH